MSDAALTLAATRVAAPCSLLVVGPLPPPFHGGSVSTEYLLTSSVRDHWQVVHLDTADRRGIDNIGRLDAGNVLLALVHGAKFLALLARHRPGVVYVPIAQNTLGVLRDLLFMVPALMTGRRLVVHVHGGGFGSFHRRANALLRAVVRAVIRRAHRVIVLGDGLRETLDGIARADRISVVPNGMPNPFPEAPRREPGDALRVLYLGNLIRTKGFLDVLEAVRRLHEGGVDVRLDLAGAWAGPSDQQAAAPLLAALGPRVVVHGAVDPDRKRELLAAADVLAFPTYYAYEGHPFVLLEAMSAALPVVTTRHAAIPETVLHERTGLLVPPCDPAALAAALARLAHDAALRQRLGDAARARFLEHYTLGTWSDRMVGVFRAVVA